VVLVPEGLRQRLRQHGQEHVLAFWDRLDDPQRRELLAELEALDLDLLSRLYAERDRAWPVPALESIAPVPVTHLDPADRKTRALGEEALRRGEVAALVVAGGQGSRLGFDRPKGMYPIGPVTDRTLFQIFAEQVHALSRRYGRPLPLLVMTSPATHEDTLAFFEEKRHFGLPPGEVHFFCQGTMPALDIATGRLLLDEPGRLFLSPNGHGGTLLALSDSGLLDRLRTRGVRHVYYFQVDNPLVKIADPLFLGHHVAVRSEASTKVIPKQSPTDRLGNMVLVNGRCAMIEYSDLPDQLARATDTEGRLRFAAGNTAIHVFDVGFLERMTRGADRIAFHVARKKVPDLGAGGRRVEPERENALKFEMFIFDVLPHAARWAVVETTRPDEFEPVKNAAGPDSPETARQALSNRAADWLARAGVRVPRTAAGDAAVPVEVSPLTALDAEGLAAKVDRGLRVEGPLVL